MTQFQSVCLYLNTILLVVFALVYVLKGKEKACSHESEEPKVISNDERAISSIGYTGRSDGNIRLVDVEEELVPVILAGVSAFTDMPASAIKVKSISRI